MTGKQTAQVMFIIAGAGIFGWVLIQQQIPNQVIEQLLTVSDRPWVILLMVNVILLILGMFIEGIAIMIMVVPIFVPLMAKIGVDPVHFGIVLTLNIMIGLLDACRSDLPCMSLPTSARSRCRNSWWRCGRIWWRWSSCSAL